MLGVKVNYLILLRGEDDCISVGVEDLIPPLPPVKEVRPLDSVDAIRFLDFNGVANSLGGFNFIEFIDLLWLIVQESDSLSS